MNNTFIDAQVVRKYEIDDQPIGCGSYGVVYRAVDRETKQAVAIKKCSNVFAHKEIAQRTYREISILKRMKHDNIIKLYTHHLADNGRDVYLVFEFMDTDLSAAMRGNHIADDDKPRIIYQLVKALKYAHSAEILHRDLKPANLLVNINERTLKVADFGLARSVAAHAVAHNPKLTTGSVGTPVYSAPEILAGATDYTSAVDMWAAGCIVAELCTGRPLFRMDPLEIINDQLRGDPPRRWPTSSPTCRPTRSICCSVWW